MWRLVLADAGVAVETVDAGHVRLRAGRQSVLVETRHLSVLTPVRVPDPPRRQGLLIVPKVTQSTLEHARAKNWSVVTDAGQYAVQIGRKWFVSRPQVESNTRRHPGPPSWALLTVARRLLAGPPASGSALAKLAGVSQSRASRVLGILAAEGLVEHGRNGYHPVDWRALLDWWLTHYQGPGGTLSYWATAKDPTQQTRDALAALPGRAAVSGDVAADLLAPWRIPTLAVVYTERGVPLGEHGFVSVGSAQEATLTLCAPADPGVWLPTSWTSQGIPLADPIQIIYDVASGPEPDRPEAADRLTAELTGRHMRAWQNAIRRNPS